jgi:hypothetical protein
MTIDVIELDDAPYVPSPRKPELSPGAQDINHRRVQLHLSPFPFHKRLTFEAAKFSISP